MKAIINRYRNDYYDGSSPLYDKVVDRSDFKRGQDKERAMRLAGDTGGSTTSGVYDYPDGVIDSKKTPTGLECKLRRGVFDKADIDTIKRLQDSLAKEEKQKKAEEKLNKDKQAIEDARQSYIDSQTGFDSSSVGSQE